MAVIKNTNPKAMNAEKSKSSPYLLSHNHPSGSTVASTPDNNLTSQLKKGCEAIGIQLLDHIILTEDTYLSYMDEGML